MGEIRPLYESTLWFESNPNSLLRNTSGDLITWPGDEPNTYEHTYDFGYIGTQKMWTEVMVNATLGLWGGVKGCVKGFFIDGPIQIDTWTRAPKAVDEKSRGSWKAGMTAALKQLRSEVGPDSFIISDGPIPMIGKSAFMYQSWLRSWNIPNSIQELQRAEEGMYGEINFGCGADRMDCVQVSLATFLLGMKEKHYVGHNSWGDPQPAYSFRLVPELYYPLGKPMSDMIMQNNTFERHFSTETHVFMDISKQVSGHYDGISFCIWWSNGESTGNHC